MPNAGMKRIIIVLALLGLGGCSIPMAMQGNFSNTPETFQGSGTANGMGDAQFRIYSTLGRDCSAVAKGIHAGTGIFTCTNGESGDFTFVGNNSAGQGQGVLAGRPFTFTYVVVGN